MYQASPSSPTSKKELIKQVKATGRENTPLGHSLIVQIKRGKQNLEEYIFIYVSVSFSFFSSSFKINWIAVRFFVKNRFCKTANCLLFLFYFSGGLGMLSLEDFKKSLGCMCF